MKLPSQAILEQAWELIRHLATGPGPATPAVAAECRKMVLRAELETTLSKSERPRRDARP